MHTPNTATSRPMDFLLEGCDPEAIKWAGGRTVEEFWKECPRPDWMFWAAHRAGVDPVLLILCVCDLARLALRYALASDPVAEATKVIDLSERWVTGDLGVITPLLDASNAFEESLGITETISVPMDWAPQVSCAALARDHGCAPSDSEA